MGLMAGGFDTTAATLNFCIYMLLSNPEEKARVQEEIDSMVLRISLNVLLIYKFLRAVYYCKGRL